MSSKPTSSRLGPLLGLFFITVGMSANLVLFADRP
jgi:Kef-type K+ transport system membrane component KefB